MSQLAAGTGYTLEKGPDNDTRHPDNHYGTPALLSALQKLASDWGARRTADLLSATMT